MTAASPTPSAPPPGSHLVAGPWWDADYAGPLLLSLENRTAQNLDLKIGDTVTVNVLGRNITARIANLRAVDWENLGINFVLVYSPGTFAGAPHSDIATLTFADGGTAVEDATLIKSLAGALPHRDCRACRRCARCDRRPSSASSSWQCAARVRMTLIAAALVLGGALGGEPAVPGSYDASPARKTLGATRAQLTAAYALEYLLIGSATAVFGVLAGSLAAPLVVTRLMEFSFVFGAGAGRRYGFACAFVTVGLGLLGTVPRAWLETAEVLRNL